MFEKGLSPLGVWVEMKSQTGVWEGLLVVELPLALTPILIPTWCEEDPNLRN